MSGDREAFVPVSKRTFEDFRESMHRAGEACERVGTMEQVGYGAVWRLIGDQGPGSWGRYSWSFVKAAVDAIAAKFTPDLAALRSEVERLTRANKIAAAEFESAVGRLTRELDDWREGAQRALRDREAVEAEMDPATHRSLERARPCYRTHGVGAGHDG